MAHPRCLGLYLVLAASPGVALLAPSSRPSLLASRPSSPRATVNAELTDGAREDLIKAGRSARFYRRVRAASEAPAMSPDLAAGTQQRFEAEAAVLAWADVREMYPALVGISDEELAEAYKSDAVQGGLVFDEYGRLQKDPDTSGMDGVSFRIGGNAAPKRERGGSGESVDVSGGSLTAGALPLVALLAAVAAATSFGSATCDSAAPGSPTAQACEVQTEYQRTGVRPENDISRYAREFRTFNERNLEKLGQAGQ